MNAQVAPKKLSRYLAKDFFTYQINTVAIAAGVSAPGSVTLDSDADFLWQKGAYFMDVAAGAQTNATRVVPLITITVTDATSGRTLMNAPVPLASLFGTGQLPFILPTPRLFPAKATISITVANFSAATTYGIPRVSFIGTKLFRRG